MQPALRPDCGMYILLQTRFACWVRCRSGWTSRTSFRWTRTVLRCFRRSGSRRTCTSWRRNCRSPTTLRWRWCTWTGRTSSTRSRGTGTSTRARTTLRNCLPSTRPTGLTTTRVSTRVFRRARSSLRTCRSTSLSWTSPMSGTVPRSTSPRTRFPFIAIRSTSTTSLTYRRYMAMSKVRRRRNLQTIYSGISTTTCNLLYFKRVAKDQGQSGQTPSLGSQFQEWKLFRQQCRAHFQTVKGIYK